MASIPAQPTSKPQSTHAGGALSAIPRLAVPVSPAPPSNTSPWQQQQVKHSVNGPQRQEPPLGTTNRPTPWHAGLIDGLGNASRRFFETFSSQSDQPNHSLPKHRVQTQSSLDTAAHTAVFPHFQSHVSLNIQVQNGFKAFWSRLKSAFSQFQTQLREQITPQVTGQITQPCILSPTQQLRQQLIIPQNFIENRQGLIIATPLSMANAPINNLIAQLNQAQKAHQANHRTKPSVQLFEGCELWDIQEKTLNPPQENLKQWTLGFMVKDGGLWERVEIPLTELAVAQNLTGLDRRQLISKAIALHLPSIDQAYRDSCENPLMVSHHNNLSAETMSDCLVDLIHGSDSNTVRGQNLFIEALQAKRKLLQRVSKPQTLQPSEQISYLTGFQPESELKPLATNDNLQSFRTRAAPTPPDSPRMSPFAQAPVPPPIVLPIPEVGFRHLNPSKPAVPTTALYREAAIHGNHCGVTALNSFFGENRVQTAELIKVVYEAKQKIARSGVFGHLTADNLPGHFSPMIMDNLSKGESITLDRQQFTGSQNNRPLTREEFNFLDTDLPGNGGEKYTPQNVLEQTWRRLSNVIQPPSSPGAPPLETITLTPEKWLEAFGGAVVDYLLLVLNQHKPPQAPDAELFSLNAGRLPDPLPDRFICHMNGHYFTIKKVQGQWFNLSSNGTQTSGIQESPLYAANDAELLSRLKRDHVINLIFYPVNSQAPKNAQASSTSKVSQSVWQPKVNLKDASQRSVYRETRGWPQSCGLSALNAFFQGDMFNEKQVALQILNTYQNGFGIFELNNKQWTETDNNHFSVLARQLEVNENFSTTGMRPGNNYQLNLQNGQKISVPDFVYKHWRTLSYNHAFPDRSQPAPDNFPISFHPQVIINLFGGVDVASMNALILKGLKNESSRNSLTEESLITIEASQTNQPIPYSTIVELLNERKYDRFLVKTVGHWFTIAYSNHHKCWVKLDDSSYEKTKYGQQRRDGLYEPLLYPQELKTSFFDYRSENNLPLEAQLLKPASDITIMIGVNEPAKTNI